MENIEIIAEKLLNEIKKYDRIIVYRHVSPDFDAYGSQFGLAYFLKDNFPDKEILAPGTSFVELAPDFYPKNDDISEEKYNEKDFLAICVDTASSARVSDQNYAKAKCIFKIDHHPNNEPYGDIIYVDEDAAACGEILYELLTSKAFKEYKIAKRCAMMLFSAIVGDTGRFQFSSTSSKTFAIASELVKFDFNAMNDVYYPMFAKDLNDFERTKIVMNNYFVSEHGVAYYILSKEDLEKMGLDSDEAKIYLSLFSMHKGIEIWCCFAEDGRTNDYRGSLRSRILDVSSVASKHTGGGHKQASGCRPKDLDEVKQIVKELDEVVIKNII